MLDAGLAPLIFIDDLASSIQYRFFIFYGVTSKTGASD